MEWDATSPRTSPGSVATWHSSPRWRRPRRDGGARRHRGRGGRRVQGQARGQPTGSYVAVLDADGELVVAVADMAATESIGVEDVDAVADAVAAAESSS